MHTLVKNASEANNSNLKSTSAHETGKTKLKPHAQRLYWKWERLKENAECAFLMYDLYPEDDDLFYDWLNSFAQLRSFEAQVMNFKDGRIAV